MAPVIESIRPLVLPKLREEKERMLKKKSKKKSIKDVIVSDEFEVSIFLTETSTRHSLIYRTKHFRDKLPPKLESNSFKLIGETDSVPVDVDDEFRAPVLQEDDEDEVRLSDIPVAETTTRRSKRQRGTADPDQDDSEAFEDDETASAIEIDSDTEAPPHKRPRAKEDDGLDTTDDKKKLAMDVSYEGFAIYGLVLCLVVKKRASAAASNSGGVAKGRPEGQAMMENWISSTQVPVGEDIP
ncbi:hypothetical protein LB507_004569 [Fusarium sp. FIESC RH6]|nr:hypothetical protein LB507_004569 [Fusarium sp. FIESC RH6]